MSAIQKLIKKYLVAANEKLVDGYEDRGYEMEDEAKKAAAELAHLSACVLAQAEKDELLRQARDALVTVRKAYPNMVHEVLDVVDAALEAGAGATAKK